SPGATARETCWEYGSNRREGTRRRILDVDNQGERAASWGFKSEPELPTYREQVFRGLWCRRSDTNHIPNTNQGRRLSSHSPAGAELPIDPTRVGLGRHR